MKMEEKKAWLLWDNFVISLGFNEIREKTSAWNISRIYKEIIHQPSDPSSMPSIKATTKSNTLPSRLSFFGN